MPMPSSWTGLDHYLVDDLKGLIKPVTAIDFGVGNGKIGIHLQRECPSCHVIGYEIFSDYLTDEVRGFYTETVVADARETLASEKVVDLVVFGDILEHFRKSEALDMLEHWNYRSRWIAVVTPLSYLQGPIDGNIHESHHCVISLEDLCRFNLVHYVKDLSVNIIYALIRGLR
jgi:hypothetical protein